MESSVEHGVPPLAPVWEIVLEPLWVPPPQVVEHVPQLHALHSQLTVMIYRLSRIFLDQLILYIKNFQPN